MGSYLQHLSELFRSGASERLKKPDAVAAHPGVKPELSTLLTSAPDYLVIKPVIASDNYKNTNLAKHGLNASAALVDPNRALNAKKIALARSVAKQSNVTSTLHKASRVIEYTLKQAAWARVLTTGDAYPTLPRVTGDMVTGIMLRANPLNNSFQRQVAKIYAAGGEAGAAYGWLLTHPMVVLHPKLVLQLAAAEREGKVSRTGLDTTGPFGSLHRIGSSVFTLEGEEHRLLRRQIMDAFRKEASLREKFDGMLAAAEAFLAEKDSAPLRLDQELTAYTMNVAGKTALGLDNVSDFAPRMTQYLQQIMVLITDPSHSVQHILDAKLRGVPVSTPDAWEKSLSVGFGKLVRQDILEPNIANINPAAQTPTNLLREISRDSGGTPEHPITPRVTQQAGMILGAAHETTASLLLWTLIELARHPDIQKRLQNELQTVQAGQPLTFDMLKSLHFLENVIREVLRLHPPVPNTSRGLKEPVTLSLDDGKTVTLQPGTFVVIPHYSIHHDESIYGADVKKFNPDRWERLDLQAMVNEALYVPFGYGPRSCPGFRFSLKEVKTFVACMLQRHGIALDHPGSIGESFPGTLKTSRPIFGRVYERGEVDGGLVHFEPGFEDPWQLPFVRKYPRLPPVATSHVHPWEVGTLALNSPTVFGYELDAVLPETYKMPLTQEDGARRDWSMDGFEPLLTVASDV